MGHVVKKNGAMCIMHEIAVDVDVDMYRNHVLQSEVIVCGRTVLSLLFL